MEFVRQSNPAETILVLSTCAVEVWCGARPPKCDGRRRAGSAVDRSLVLSVQRADERRARDHRRQRLTCRRRARRFAAYERGGAFERRHHENTTRRAWGRQAGGAEAAPRCSWQIASCSTPAACRFSRRTKIQTRTATAARPDARLRKVLLGSARSSSGSARSSPPRSCRRGPRPVLPNTSPSRGIVAVLSLPLRSVTLLSVGLLGTSR
jgi:hypothetical protein